MFCCVRDRIRIGDAGAIESERAGLTGEGGLQVGCRKREVLVQKSRST